MVYLRLHRSLSIRILLLSFFFGLIFAAIAGRVFSLAVVEHRTFVKAAQRQHQLLKVLPFERGTIFLTDRHGARQAVAIQKTFSTLIAVPKAIRDPEGVAQELSAILDLPPEDIRRKLLKRDDPYEVIARKLDDDKVEAITARRDARAADGLLLLEESRRIYPEGAFAASLLGFVRPGENGDEQGEYGIEKFYDSILAGERGFFEGVKGAEGYWLAIGKRVLNPPVNGEDLVLTVDPNIQFAVEEELGGLQEKWRAESGSILALEPKTGRILAFTSRPTFDPNEYAKVQDYSHFRAPLIDSQFELGSVFKPITMAAAVNEGLITATSTYRDPGTVQIGRSSISNFDDRSYGVPTMTQVLERSLNTGAVYVERLLGKERFLEYVKRFGFGEKTGIDFPSESSGDISNLGAGRDIDYATASFGQGIAVTPIQLAAAMSAIANHGVLMKSYLVEKIIDDAGNEELRQPREVRRVLSPEAAETLTKMLVSAVRNGFENKAGVKGYFVAGKTGTAQIPLKDRRGYSDEVIHTFVGYAPAFSPKFLIFLQLVKPQGNRFAANTLTPAFHNLAEFMLNYYEIPPDEK